MRAAIGAMERIGKRIMSIGFYDPRCDNCRKKPVMLSKVKIFGKVWDLCPRCKTSMGYDLLHKGAVISDPEPTKHLLRVTT